MFGAPSRINAKNGDTVFQLEVNTTPLGIEMEYTEAGLIFNNEAQSRFRTLQSLVLSELANEKHLFRNPPTLTSLEAITPNWGFVTSGSKSQFSPYAEIITDVKVDKLPCLVDIQLKRLDISRSTIRSAWKLHYLGPKKSEIDFSWPAPTITLDEIIEVSDVPAANDNKASLKLLDSEELVRQKMEAKQKTLAAFVKAKEARVAAEELARNFYEMYDLSDSESAFTEWLSDSDESDSD